MSRGFERITRSRRAPVRALSSLGLLLLMGLFLAPQAAAAAAADSVSAGKPPVPASAGAALPAPKLGGYLQVRELAQEQVGLTTYLNRARFSIDGALPNKFSYRLLTELQASAGAKSAATVSLREAVIKWTSAPFTLTAGEFKAPFTREYLISLTQLETADLATVIDSLGPKYDVGVMAEYALGATATLSAGVFNGEGANAIANRDSTVMFVGRAAVCPIPQLGVGVSGTRDGADSLRWGVDACVQHKGAVVRVEYVTRHLSGRDRAKDDFGWYVFESYRATPRVQLIARQEDFQRPARGISRRVRGLAYGANLELAPTRVKLLLEFSRRVTGARQLRADTFIAQLQVTY